MTIILFHDLNASPKILNYSYDSNRQKYNTNNFIKLLEQIDSVYIPEISFTHIYHYIKIENLNNMFHKIETLNFDDLQLDKYIKKMYDVMDKKIFKPPYIVMGHGHGIYYACEFAKQFDKYTKYIISLDGSWITHKINKKILKINFKNFISKITNQCDLDSILDKIKNNKTNTTYINMLIDHIKFTHVNFCSHRDYENLENLFITIRNLSINNDEIAFAFEENNILSTYENHAIYLFEDATHELWFHDKYKKKIIKLLMFLKDI